MWSSRLFWKPLVICLAGILVAEVVMGAVLTNWRTGQVRQSRLDRLRVSAQAIAGQLVRLVDDGEFQELADQVKRLDQETGLRITVIEQDGIVLAESRYDPLEMEDHSNRLEIRLAREIGTGSSSRTSLTLDRDMSYMAIRVPRADGTSLFVRVGENEHEISADLESVTNEVHRIVFLVGLAAVGVSLVSASFFSRPVLSLIEEAHSVAVSHLGRDAVVFEQNELDSVRRVIRQLDEELIRLGSQIQQEAKRLDVVLGGMDEGLIVVDANEKLLLANPAACQMFDIEMPRDMGRPVWELIRHRSVERAISKAMKRDRPHQRIVELRGNPSKHLAVNATRLQDEESALVIVMFHDITDLHRLENVRREFVANVSHELKTPLASIQGFTESLLQGAMEDSEYNREFLQRILEQADRLNLLIQDMLALARVEAGEHPFDDTAVDVQQVVNGCLAVQQASAESRQIELLNAPPQSPLSVQADEEGVRQILDNLLDNAIKYSDPGGRVEVGWELREEMVQLWVSDQGRGIPAESLDRVFERFYRVDKARSRELGGTGLGLAIVKHLAQAFEGDVWLTSTLGEGTTVCVSLPQANLPMDVI
ncbi:MAG: PAS domain-containing sensor histidine kinase [Planctomycetaceae bacterium]|nr:PAS domain-containing sensor histidine kinase [Planctomycetaceae bacterium]|tara:strand:- start:9331 stop:11115 length:1785 start_codon:yes stop_codon:yes gene_type:complete